MNSSTTPGRQASGEPDEPMISPRTPRERRPRCARRWLHLLVVAILLLDVAAPVAAQDGEQGIDTTGIPLPVPTLDTNAESVEEIDIRPFYDSSRVEARRLPEDALERYRADEEFQYDREARDPQTLWQRLLRWLYDRFSDLFGTSEAEATFWVWLFRAIAVAAVVFVVVKLTQTDLRFIFRKGSERNVSDFIEVDENIHEMNFDALIEESAMEKNYRKGVRLLYLRTLKQLTDMELIEWRKDKTNREYLRELRKSELRDSFADLTMMFEYIWYGDVPVGESLFRDVRARFNEFGATVAHRT